MGESTNEQRAKALRRAGLSRRQIADALGLKSGGSALSRWLKDVPPPEWTRRPNAKDDVRVKAETMRRTGMSYREIGAEIGVSTSTLSLWLRDIELTDDQEAELERRRGDHRAKAGATNRARRLSVERNTIEDARAQVPTVAESELFVAGVVAYWAEGTKSKPWNPHRRVTFTNSDPDLIRLFLRWLALIGVNPSECSFRVAIHVNSDVEAATSFWADVTGVDVSAFGRPTLKRHNPKTVRRNVEADYHGCLVVRVARSTDLHRRIEGWWRGIVAGAMALT